MMLTTQWACEELSNVPGEQIELRTIDEPSDQTDVLTSRTQTSSVDLETELLVIRMSVEQHAHKSMHKVPQEVHTAILVQWWNWKWTISL